MGYRHTGKDFNDVMFHLLSATGFVFFFTRYQANAINHFISQWCAILLNLTTLAVPYATPCGTVFEENTGVATSISQHAQHLK